VLRRIDADLAGALAGRRFSSVVWPAGVYSNRILTAVASGGK